MPDKTATGFIAQTQLMTYATPGIEQVSEGAGDWNLAAARAGLDWEPTVRPLGDLEWGINVPGVHGVWHDRTFLGSATERHQLISHAGMGKVVDAIVSIHDKPVTALVVLDHGRRVGARVTHDTMRITGDPSPIDLETWVWLRHDAKGSLTVLENAQRMFCTNQLGGLSNRAAAMRVRHTGDVDVKVDELVEQLKTNADDWKLWEQEMDRLRMTRVTDDRFDQFTQLYIPKPIEPVSPSRALNAQAVLNKLWRRYSDELGRHAYAGFQAIAEFEDKRRAARGPVGRFQRAIQPNPNKDRGVRMLVQVARG